MLSFIHAYAEIDNNDHGEPDLYGNGKKEISDINILLPV